MALLSHWGSVDALLGASAQALTQVGLSEAQVRALTQPNWTHIDRQFDWMQRTHTQMQVYTAPEYPPQLREISSLPLVLFVQGNPALLHQPQLAMVGARTPTAKGREIAQHFAEVLGRAGLVITSGLALGIDGASHQGALIASAKTIAVLGCGLDTIYPQAHQGLAQEILAAGGSLVSEFLPGTLPRAQHFPRRNRIISGLSLGVLVVEAANKSGSLITARYALEQNREVFAIPGAIHNPLAKGCHQLLKQGAKLVETAQDVLEELPEFRQSFQVADFEPILKPDKMLPDTKLAAEQVAALPMRSDKSSSKQSHEVLKVEPMDQVLLKCLGFETTPVDVIIQRTGLSAEQVSSRLLMLELQGQVLQVPGGYVKRNA